MQVFQFMLKYIIKRRALRGIALTVVFLLVCLFANSQTKKSPWITVNSDYIATISYNRQITNMKNGYHVVWIKTVYHTNDWQNYFAEQIGSRTPVVTIKTKAMYDERYNYAMVRQVIAYSKTGKVIWNSGDDTSAGWGVVNASDPVGIVGEYLGKKFCY